MKTNIFSRCIYDVDNRYVDLNVQVLGQAFLLTMKDTSDHEKYDAEIEMYLTKDELQKVIERLTEVMNERKAN